ncbi:hypothetical protein [Scytonema sp. NUACC26]
MSAVYNKDGQLTLVMFVTDLDVGAQGIAPLQNLCVAFFFQLDVT